MLDFPGPTTAASATTTTASALNKDQITGKAREFEAILLGQWLQSAESSFGSVPGGDPDQDAGDEQMRGFGVQQLAKALSDSGGVGIAKIVAAALEHASSPAQLLPKGDQVSK